MSGLKATAVVTGAVGDLQRRIEDLICFLAVRHRLNVR
jgi:hypothetical protein